MGGCRTQRQNQTCKNTSYWNDQNWNIREIKETLKTLSKEQGLVKKKLQRTHRSKIYLLCAYRRQWKSLFSSSSYEAYAPETCVWQTLLVAHPTESSFNWASGGRSFSGCWPSLQPQGLNPDWSNSKPVMVVWSLCLWLVGKGIWNHSRH